MVYCWGMVVKHQAEEYYGLNDVARLLGVSPQTIHNYMRDRLMPSPLRLPGGQSRKGNARWRRSTIDAWIKGL